MITKVNDIELRILSLFTKSYDKEHYIREVEKLLNISSRTALVNLAKLEKKGILESKIRGKIKLYSIRKSGISKEYFLLAEQYKRINFLEKNPLIKEILEKAGPYLKGIVLVFGSYAKGIQKEDSDLDLFVVGKHDRDKILEIGNKYGIEISIKSYPYHIFKKELHNNILLKEVEENHIIIKGAEYFVRQITQWAK